MTFTRAALAAATLCAGTHAAVGAQLPTIELRPGLVITRSVRVVPKTW